MLLSRKPNYLFPSSVCCVQEIICRPVSLLKGITIFAKLDQVAEGSWQLERDQYLHEVICAPKRVVHSEVIFT